MQVVGFLKKIIQLIQAKCSKTNLANDCLKPLLQIHYQKKNMSRNVGETNIHIVLSSTTLAVLKSNMHRSASMKFRTHTS